MSRYKPYKLAPVLSEEQRAIAKRRFEWLSHAAIVQAGALVAVLVALIQRNDKALIVTYIVLIVSWITYVSLLGGLATLLGKSRITWVGGAFLFGPLGIFVSYVKMREEATRARFA